MKSTDHLYFAAPLFSSAELQFNRNLVATIETLMPVFLPQRDGGLFVDLRAKGVDILTASAQIAAIDRRAIESSAGVVAVLDGQSIDEGVAFEVGYAIALGKQCIGMQTDPRRTTMGFSNPMILSALIDIATTEDELMMLIRAHVLDRGL